MVRHFSIASLALALIACDRPAEPVEPQRIPLDAARHRAQKPIASPDTANARWTVAPNGQAITFGNAGAPPLLSLACDLTDAPPSVTVIRHAETRPGEKALFPVIGNGTIARFKTDAALEDGEWRWQASVPANDALLEVFTGARAIEATLPGAGTLKIAGSRVPGEFIGWCAKGGTVARAAEREEAAESDAAN